LLSTSKIAPSVIEPFQYPYAAVNGAQPQPHHHDMLLASIAAAEYGFAVFFVWFSVLKTIILSAPDASFES